jgi:hypothetical protein
MKVLSLLVFVFLTIFSFGQIAVPNSSAITQNFDGMNATLNLPSNWKMHASTGSPNWTAASTALTQQSSSGSPTTGGTYNWGTSASERAAGAMTSGSFASPNNLLAFFSNTHATDNITQLTLSYDAERYRINTALASVQFYYSLNGSTWIAVSSGDIASASFPTGTSVYTHASPLTISVSGISITGLNIAPTSNFYLRWNINTTGSNSQGIGIDNFTLTATHSPATNIISISNILSTSFIVDCSTSDAGLVDFSATGTYNVGNTFTAQLSNASGSFASPTNLASSVTASGTDPTGTINFTIPAGTPTGAGYRIRVISLNPSATSLDNGSNITITNTPCTVTTSNVSGSPFNIHCTNSISSSGTVDFVSVGTYDPTNNYIVQLSDATGSFASPIQIGLSSNNSSNSGTLNFTIPETLESGTAYRMRIVSTNPVVNGSNNGTNLTVTQAAPCLPSLPSQGLIINEWSNGPSGEKEYYEFVVAGQCGDLVDIRGYILDDNNATFTNPADYDAVASGIAPGHFRFSNSAIWSNIPVGSLIVIYNANDPNPLLPPDDINDSNNDSLYVIPHTSTLFERCGTMPTSIEPDSIYTPCAYSTSALTGWAALSLRNAGDAIQIRNPNGSYYFGVSYGGSEMTGGPHNLKLFNGSGSGMCGWFNNGDLFDISNWSSGTVAGNETPGLPNNASNLAWLRLMRNPNSLGCPITVLPSTTINFKAFNENDINLLYWKTQSEQNNDYFTIFHSTDGVNYQELEKVQGSGNSNTFINYTSAHKRPPGGINYYKLSSTDYDGTTYDKGITSVMVEGEGTYFDPYTSQLKFSEKSDYLIYTTNGKLIQRINNNDAADFNYRGMILIQDQRNLRIERLFIP